MSSSWVLKPTAFLRNLLHLLVTANHVPRSLAIFTPMMLAIGSSETPVLTEPHGVTSKTAAFFSVLLFGNYPLIGVEN
jgi:hypothetical protein